MEIFANQRLWLVECASIRRERVEVLLDRRVDISFVKKIIEEALALSLALSLFLSGLFSFLAGVFRRRPPAAPQKCQRSLAIFPLFLSLGWRWRRVFSYFQLAAALLTACSILFRKKSCSSWQLVNFLSLRSKSWRRRENSAGSLATCSTAPQHFGGKIEAGFCFDANFKKEKYICLCLFWQ